MNVPIMSGGMNLETSALIKLEVDNRATYVANLQRIRMVIPQKAYQTLDEAGRYHRLDAYGYLTKMLQLAIKLDELQRGVANPVAVVVGDGFELGHPYHLFAYEQINRSMGRNRRVGVQIPARMFESIQQNAKKNERDPAVYLRSCLRLVLYLAYRAQGIVNPVVVITGGSRPSLEVSASEASATIRVRQVAAGMSDAEVIVLLSSIILGRDPRSTLGYDKAKSLLTVSNMSYPTASVEVIAAFEAIVQQRQNTHS